ncbi:ATP-binding protein [Sphingomonas sp. Leaf62]|uniref:ATP-binding protein n=1 Tax=Sphingomonas sp. Leaf62 TaxID=1736228 RepID=UPI0009E9B407|nr:ATP-binding protein [Sphingomonas sp. Leaf62]
MEELIDDLSRLFVSRWPSASLTTKVEPDLEAPLDRDQLNQALWALLQNAVEAAGPDTAAIVHVDAFCAEQNLVIEIRDEGPSVAASDANIFRPFHSTKPNGTGISLSLARQILQTHGGNITLTQALPTTFRCRLPISRAHIMGKHSF